MKFGKYLERHQISEWRKKYVYYKMFKKQIKAIKRAISDDENNDRSLLMGTLRRKMTVLKPNDVNPQQTNTIEASISGLPAVVGTDSMNLPPNSAIHSSTGVPATTRVSTANQDREQKKFHQMLNDEFEKVNTFYQQREEEFIKQFRNIRDILTSLPTKQKSKDKKDKSKEKDKHPLSTSMSPFSFLNHRKSRRYSLSQSVDPSSMGSGSGASVTSPSKQDMSHSFDSSLPSDNATTRSIEEIINCSNINNNNSSTPPNTQSAAQNLIHHASKAETYTPKFKPTKIKRSLKRALQENYREIEILKEYVHLNHTAFRKIFKKYDKALGLKKSEELMERTVDQYFYKSKKIALIEHEIEVLYTDYYNPGNRREAMTKLRINQDYRAPSHVIFHTGLLTGASIILFIFCVRYMVGNVSIFYFDNPYPVDFLSMFILFRCLLLPIVMIWYFGFLMYVCNGSKINDILILGWDPRTTTNYQHILLLASSLTFLWNVALYLYVYLSTHISGKIPLIFPFILFISFLFLLICPFDILHRPSRYWLIKTFGRIFSAPFLTVKFKDFFFGDQFTSLALVLSDFEYTICFFVYDIWTGGTQCWKINPYVRPVLVSIPPLLRALQSIRRYRDSKQRIHMMNFGKYCAAILTSIMSAISHSPFSKGAVYRPLIAIWIVTLTISSVYSCTWDYLMDWDLLHTNSKNFLLRDNLVYRHKPFYYWAILSNAVMRVAWSITVSFESYSSKEKELILLCTSLLEVTRRFQWNFFRLENEHLNNVGKFRAFDLRIPDVFPHDQPKTIVTSPKSDTVGLLDALVNDNSSSSSNSSGNNGEIDKLASNNSSDVNNNLNNRTNINNNITPVSSPIQQSITDIDETNGELNHNNSIEMSKITKEHIQ